MWAGGGRVIPEGDCSASGSGGVCSTGDDRTSAEVTDVTNRLTAIATEKVLSERYEHPVFEWVSSVRYCLKSTNRNFDRRVEPSCLSAVRGRPSLTITLLKHQLYYLKSVFFCFFARWPRGPAESTECPFTGPTLHYCNACGWDEACSRLEYIINP